MSGIKGLSYEKDFGVLLVSSLFSFSTNSEIRIELTSIFVNVEFRKNHVKKIFKEKSSMNSKGLEDDGGPEKT